MAKSALPAPGVGELTVLLLSGRLHLEAPDPSAATRCRSQQRQRGFHVAHAGSYSVWSTCPARDRAAAAAGRMAIAIAATRTPAASAAMSPPGRTGTATTPASRAKTRQTTLPATRPR